MLEPPRTAHWCDVLVIEGLVHLCVHFLVPAICKLCAALVNARRTERALSICFSITFHTTRPYFTCMTTTIYAQSLNRNLCSVTYILISVGLRKSMRVRNRALFSSRSTSVGVASLRKPVRYSLPGLMPLPCTVAASLKFFTFSKAEPSRMPIVSASELLAGEPTVPALLCEGVGGAVDASTASAAAVL
jgi:hypothetical protein